MTTDQGFINHVLNMWSLTPPEFVATFVALVVAIRGILAVGANLILGPEK